MVTKYQRLSVVVEPSVFSVIRQIAKKEQVSLSNVARYLIREALEIWEDKYWDKIASKREENFDWKKGINHNNAWK